MKNGFMGSFFWGGEDFRALFRTILFGELININDPRVCSMMYSILIVILCVTVYGISVSIR